MTEQRFDTFLQVRLTTHDKERIKARAIEAGMQTSEYVRKRALGERVAPPRTAREAAENPLRQAVQKFEAIDNYLKEERDPRDRLPAERQPPQHIHPKVREARASVVLDGETMYEGHPAVVASMRQASRNNP